MSLFAFNISAREAADLDKLPNNTVLISINDEYVDLYSLKLDRNSPDILTVQFTDITEDIEHRGKIYHKLDIKTAHKILKFVSTNKSKSFLIHCAAGISRSSAVSMFIHLRHGHKLKDNFWRTSDPNTHVLGMLIREKIKPLDKLNNKVEF